MNIVNEIIKWLFDYAVKTNGWAYTDDFILWYDKKAGHVVIKRRNLDTIDRG